MAKNLYHINDGADWLIVAESMADAIGGMPEEPDPFVKVTIREMPDDETFTEMDVDGTLGGDREWTAEKYVEANPDGILGREY